MAESFADSARSSVAGRAAGIASEIAQYRGWLEHATGADTACRKSLRKAVDLAIESGDPDRLVHGLSFTAYVDLERGDWAESAALSDAALRVPGVHPLIGVYERFQRARVHAVNGEPCEAQRLLVMADKTADSAAAEGAPDAGYWYTPGFFGLQRARVLRTLGRVDRSRDEVEAAVDALPVEHRRSEWAAKWRRAAEGEADVPH